MEEGILRILYAFLVMTIDGFYEAPDGEFDWPNVDEEFNQYSVANLNDTDMILFGRVTYEGMRAIGPPRPRRRETRSSPH